MEPTDPIVEPCMRVNPREMQRLRGVIQFAASDYCDTLQSNCEVDATAIDTTVAALFTEAVDLVCNLPDVGDRFNDSKTEPSPSAPGPVRDTCTYDENYFFEGHDCIVQGDPHTRLWNGDNHDFQGQPNTGKDQFYYVHRCQGTQIWNLPFNILGRHYRWSASSVSGLDYITIELFDDTGDVYYLWLSTGIAA
eukprot:281190_1